MTDTTKPKTTPCDCGSTELNVSFAVPQVWCSECGMSGPVCDDRDKAIIAWNKVPRLPRVIVLAAQPSEVPASDAPVSDGEPPASAGGSPVKPEMKPCPFCGGECLIADVQVYLDGYETWFSAGCPNCQTWGKTRNKPEDTAKQWNARAPQWQPIAEVPRDEVIDLWHRTAGRLADCWWSEGWGGGAIGLIDDDFTHWRYAPGPPSAEHKCDDCGGTETSGGQANG